MALTERTQTESTPLDALRQLIERHRHRPGACLEVLQAVQAHIGYVPAHAVPIIAETLNLSRAEVHGTLSFYPFLRSAPGGRHTIGVCRAEACQSVNGRAIEQHLQQRLQVGWNETTSDGRVTLRPMFCLGLCAIGPSLMVDQELHGRMTTARADQLLDELAARDGS
jgi:formate dehydrogenase subunit gamma